MRLVYCSDTLSHHGILGQHWGKRNGPPYPLSGKEHSASEKKAGWRKSLDKGSKKAYDKGNKKTTNGSSEPESTDKKGLNKNQKRAIVIGASAAAVAVAAIGTYALYKSGKLDFLARKGKQALAGELPQGLKKLKVSESLSDTLRNANPHRGDPSYFNNCSSCGIAAFLRSKGFDVTAKSTGGQMQNMGGVVEECFKNAKVFDGSAVKFGRSKKDAAEMLVRRFGQNADGVCSVQFKGNGGHIFNWKISDGVVKFFDGQSGLNDAQCGKLFWETFGIDTNGALQFARLDNLEINPIGLLKWITTK